MRLIIIPEDTMISIDGEPITGCDMSWVPEFVGDATGVSQKVHALQWYDDHGEIELVTKDSNIEITELGVFEQAITAHAERKVVAEAEAAAAAAEASSISYNIDIDALLAELESEEDANVGVSTT
jgi:hypothetical protein